MTRHIIATIILFVFSCGLSSAQDNDLDALLRNYHTDSKKYFKEIENVDGAQARKTSFRKALKTKDIVTAVDRFSSRWNTKAAALCFFYEKGKLHLYAVDGDKILASSSKLISPDSLVQLEIMFRNAIGTAFDFTIDSTFVVRGSTSTRRGKSGLDSTRYKELSNLVFDRNIIQALQNTEHLLISPVYNLFSFPYGILKPFDNNEFLIEKFAIQVVPNLYELANARYPSDSLFFAGLQKVTIAGNPFFIGRDPKAFYGDSNRYINDQYKYAQLPYTEVQTIYMDKLLMAFSDSIRKNECFVQHELALKTKTVSCAEGSDVIYVATHGISNVRDPWDSSYLVFAQVPDTASDLNSNLWTAREILQKRLHARLAVLSACNTGTGQLWKTGIVSLANSFYYAGTQKVVSTLWSVSDKFTYEIMSEFMRDLARAKNRHPARSLQLAQKRFIMIEPMLWAPFLLYGL